MNSWAHPELCKEETDSTQYIIQDNLQKMKNSSVLLNIGSFHTCTCRFTDMDKFYDDVRKLRVEEVDKDCPYYTEIFLEILKKN